MTRNIKRLLALDTVKRVRTLSVRYGSVLLLLILVNGCGYRLAGMSGKMPGGVTTLSIPVFINHTGKPDIEAIATTLFAEEFRVTVNVKPDSDARFEGEILSYSLKAVSYTANDINFEYRLTVTFGLKLVLGESGRVLWSDAHVVDYEDFIVDSTDVTLTEEAEINAFRKISRDTARNIKERMLDNF